jgi:hypothetical protein
MADSFFILILVCASAFVALLEIQIEGGAGWAQLFVFSLGHLPYTMGVQPGWSTELRILAFLIFFWVLEDFLWFVFNPEYGIRRFRRGDLVARRDLVVVHAERLLDLSSNRHRPVCFWPGSRPGTCPTCGLVNPPRLD